VAGNIRELRNVVERAMITATAGQLTITLAAPVHGRDHPQRQAVDVEREHIRAILESTRWRIPGKTGAAELLGLKPTTLETRMAKLGLTRPSKAA
jgi:transcriptional regulator with GAF, ATPase, and Fis domain